MGLALYAIASRLFPARQEDDPEKAVPRGKAPWVRRKRQREQHDANGQGVSGQDFSDDDLENPSAPRSRNIFRSGRRIPTWTNASIFGPTKRSYTATTTGSSTWFSRAWSSVFSSGDRHAEIEKFVPNYRYSPIISGVVIPFSILLEIPGVTERWYIRTENNKTVDTRPNPVLLDVGMAISIACAVAANISLVLRFLEKKIKITTITCICFLTLHDTINIITVTIFGVSHRSDDGYTYGESFWMTLCSTIASTITNYNLIYDYIRVPDFANSGSGLTRRQRGVVIIVILLLLYIALGALVNSFLLNLSYIDGLYFTTVSIETIGFGDIKPDSTGSRVFICAYIAVGIVIIGVAIALMRETILEGLEIAYRRRLRGMRTRRREARRFRRWEARWRDAVEWRLRAQGAPVWMPDRHPDDDDAEGLRFVGLGGEAAAVGSMHWFRRCVRMVVGSRPPPADPAARPHRHVRGHPRGMHLNINALSDGHLQAAALEAGVPLGMFVDTSGTDRRLSVGDAGRRRGSDNAEPAVAWAGWPSHPQTPTHAQVGRMAAMVTKFAVWHSGHHLHLSGLGNAMPHEDLTPHGASTPHEDSTPNQGSDSEQDAEEAREGDERIAAAGREAGQDHHADVHEGRGTLADIGRYARVPRWVREFAHGERQKADFSYGRYQEEIKSEEKRAYISKMIVGWTLFFVFWFLGSGIFCVTEGWSFGIAMYFCFTAFLTTGYGDYAPVTPAGRSVFVVWALFGVATMTILISVLQDVSELRYKSALHSRVFDNAVKQYRKKQAQESAQPPRAHSRLQHAHATAGRLAQAVSGADPDARSVAGSRAGAAHEDAQRELEALPGTIIQYARTFHDYMRFFVDTRGHPHVGAESAGTNVPEELEGLLDDIAQGEHIGERVKREILQDDDAKKTLFMLSIERALKKMIHAAEQTLAVLAERDTLLALQEQQLQAASRECEDLDTYYTDDLAAELPSRRESLETVRSTARSISASTPHDNSASPHASTSDDRAAPVHSHS